MRRVLAALFFVSCAMAAIAAPAPGTLADPAQEARARNLQKELRCMVCQGESIDESSAPLAADLRALIREHIKRGESDDDIKRYLVARYGDFILMEPPFDADTYALWLTPFAVLIVAAGVAIWVVRRAAKAPQAEA
ncbi:MAG TPA: cytochrome c-type biogenesis protein [Rhizomicrobium sp.]|jgi:cytochrome c-type biogenesis protein CcmH|nr:cytochrome c-type biogenesis protein [Rhizomicrobium sp.]